MPGEKKIQRVRRTVSKEQPPQAPGPPAQLTVDAGVLAHLATQVGELTGEVRGMRTEIADVKDRIGSLEDTVHEQALQNEQARGELKSEISALGATVAGLVADKRTPPPNEGASEGRKESDPIEKLDKTLDFGAKWGPKVPALLKALGTALAVLLSWWATVWASKGGHTQP